MAGEGITFNNRKVQRFFDKIGKNFEDIKDHDKRFWGAITAIAFRNVIKHFEQQQGPKGKWKSWSDVYQSHMQRIGKSGNNILQDTGALRQSVNIASTTIRMKKGQLLYNDAKTKNNYPYAKAHDEGSGPLPQREFMWLSDKALSNISKLTAAYYLRGL